MTGEIVPIVLLPRITSYVGPGTYATAPLNVEEFFKGSVAFWRGPLVGGAAEDPFVAYFEESHDAVAWTEVPPNSVDLVDRIDSYEIAPLTKRWFRIRVVLAADANGVVAISMWMAGVMERRVE